MARPSLFTHRKFLGLASRLRSRALAAGVLELVWHVAYESGDPRVGTAEAVAYLTDWQGDPEELAAALVSAGFVLREPDGMLVVHDLWDHAPEYVRKRLRREEERRRKTDVGRTVTAERRTTADNGGQCPDNGGQREPFGRTPAPAPAPAPAPDEEVARADPKGEKRKRAGRVAAEVIEEYNRLLGDVLPRVQRVTDSRVGVVNARVREHGREAVSEVLRIVAETPGLLGANDRGWRASFDWIMGPRNFVKVLEGSYSNWGRSVSPGGRETPEEVRLDPEYVRSYQLYGGDPLWEGYASECERTFGPGGEKGAWPRFEDWKAARNANEVPAGPAPEHDKGV